MEVLYDILRGFHRPFGNNAAAMLPKQSVVSVWNLKIEFHQTFGPKLTPQSLDC